jgi:hypothetical protein
VAHAHTHHFVFVLGQLDATHRTARRIRLAAAQAAGEVVAGARELEYDVLILAFGSRANDFGTPGVVEQCHFIDSQDQADAFNARLPKAALVARLRSSQSPGQTARQLPDSSTLIWVEPSSTGETRLHVADRESLSRSSGASGWTTSASARSVARPREPIMASIKAHR